jgi:ring-1,2-phenylacetyl-CoA epoxidase subunit PaaC
MVKWSSEMGNALGDGTEESHTRMQDALQMLNPWVQELFLPADFDFEAAETGAGILPEQFKDEWYRRVNKVFDAASLPNFSSEKGYIQMLSGKNGIHSEQLGLLLAEMQVLQRTYPGAKW